MTIPDWKRAPTNSKFKGEITRFYTQYLTENCHVLLEKGKEVVISGDTDVLVLLIYHFNKLGVDELYFKLVEKVFIQT